MYDHTVSYGLVTLQGAEFMAFSLYVLAKNNNKNGLKCFTLSASLKQRSKRQQTQRSDITDYKIVNVENVVCWCSTLVRDISTTCHEM